MPRQTPSLALARADVYRMLSACYYQPEPCFLEEEIFAQLGSALALVEPQLVPAVSTLEASFRRAGIDVLLRDYTRLFLGPFEIMAHPYGSVYLDGEKVVMGDSTMRALALYRQAGFDVAGDFAEMPDHLAVELEFLYLLCCRIGGAVDAAERERFVALRRRFLDEHPGRWVGVLAEKMREHAETDFYRQLARLTAEFIASEAREPAGKQPQ